jgi:hypothetical protein
VAAERLAENGVAYVSYNAMPGCRLRHLVRELLEFRFGADATAPSELKPVREFLQAFAKIEDQSKGAFLEVLKREIAFVQDLPDFVLYHDDLASDSKAFYLHEFVSQARERGLQYLGEADIAEMFMLAGSGEFDAMVGAWSNHDWIAREQYFDFVKGRRFRQTLLCRDTHRLRRDFGPDIVEGFALRSRLRLEDDRAAMFDRSEASFRAGNRGVKIVDPIAKSALAVLEEGFPDSIAFADLLREATTRCNRAGLGCVDGEWRQALVQMMWALVRTGLVELVRDPLRLAARPGTRPQASRLVRDQIAHGTALTGALHDSFSLADDAAARMVLAMDGTRDRTTLERLACERPGETPALAAGRLDELLAFLARHGANAG